MRMCSGSFVSFASRAKDLELRILSTTRLCQGARPKLLNRLGDETVKPGPSQLFNLKPCVTATKS